jgi:hypothetical protein
MTDFLLYLIKHKQIITIIGINNHAAILLVIPISLEVLHHAALQYSKLRLHSISTVMQRAVFQDSTSNGLPTQQIHLVVGLPLATPLSRIVAQII